MCATELCATELRRYLETRLLQLRIALLWGLLVAATALTADAGTSLWRVLACAFFIVAFRLWDDLSDLGLDRIHHPARVLATTTRLTCFRYVLIALLAVLLLLTSARALGVLWLAAAFALLYRIDRANTLPRPWRGALVLAKYPAFVLALADDPTGVRALVVATAAYAIPMIDEVRDGGMTVLRPAMIVLGVALIAWLILNN